MEESLEGLKGLKGISLTQEENRKRALESLKMHLAASKSIKAFNLTYLTAAPSENIGNKLGSSGYGSTYDSYDNGILNTGDLQNLLDYRAEALSGLVLLGTGFAKMLTTGLTSSVSGIATAAMGLGYAGSKIYDLFAPEDKKANMNFSLVWNNSVSLTMLNLDDAVDEAMPLYTSLFLQLENWWNRLDEAAFWSDLIKNAGFMVGAAYSGMGFSAGLRLFGRAMSGVAEATNGLKVLGKATLLASKVANNGKVANLLAGTYAAAGEAGMEALNTYKDSIDLKSLLILADLLKYSLDIYDKVSKGEIDLDYGEYLIEEALKNSLSLIELARKEAVYSGNLDFGLNMMLLGPLNAFLFGKLFKKGFNTSLRGAVKTATDDGTKLVEEAATATGATLSEKELAAKAILDKIGKTIQKFEPNLKKKWQAGLKPLSEGVEEMNLQWATDFSTNLYSPKDGPDGYYEALLNRLGLVETMDMMKSIANGFSSSWGDSKLWELFFSGALMAMFGLPTFGKVRNANAVLGKGKFIGWSGGIALDILEINQDNERATKAAEILNKSLDKYNKVLGTYVLGNTHRDLMEKAIEAKDKVEYLSLQDNLMWDMISSFKEAGRLDALKTIISNEFTDYSDEDLENLANSTTVSNNGILEGEFVDLKTGKLMSDTEEGRQKMRKILESNRKDILNSVTEIADIRDRMDAVTMNILPSDKLDELTWLGWKVNRLDSRRKDIITNNKEFINGLSQAIDEKIKAADLLINKIAQERTKERLEELLSDAKAKKDDPLIKVYKGRLDALNNIIETYKKDKEGYERMKEYLGFTINGSNIHDGIRESLSEEGKKTMRNLIKDKTFIEGLIDLAKTSSKTSDMLVTDILLAMNDLLDLNKIDEVVDRFNERLEEYRKDPFKAANDAHSRVDLQLLEQDTRENEKAINLSFLNAESVQLARETKKKLKWHYPKSLIDKWIERSTNPIVLLMKLIDKARERALNSMMASPELRNPVKGVIDLYFDSIKDPNEITESSMHEYLTKYLAEHISPNPAALLAMNNLITLALNTFAKYLKNEQERRSHPSTSTPNEVPKGANPEELIEKLAKKAVSPLPINPNKKAEEQAKKKVNLIPSITLADKKKLKKSKNKKNKNKNGNEEGAPIVLTEPKTLEEDLRKSGIELNTDGSISVIDTPTNKAPEGPLIPLNLESVVVSGEYRGVNTTLYKLYTENPVDNPFTGENMSEAMLKKIRAILNHVEYDYVNNGKVKEGKAIRLASYDEINKEAGGTKIIFIEVLGEDNKYHIVGDLPSLLLEDSTGYNEFDFLPEMYNLIKEGENWIYDNSYGEFEVGHIFNGLLPTTTEEHNVATIVGDKLEDVEIGYVGTGGIFKFSNKDLDKNLDSENGVRKIQNPYVGELFLVINNAASRKVMVHCKTVNYNVENKNASTDKVREVTEALFKAKTFNKFKEAMKNFLALFYLDDTSNPKSKDKNDTSETINYHSRLAIYPSVIYNGIQYNSIKDAPTSDWRAISAYLVKWRLDKGGDAEIGGEIGRTNYVVPMIRLDNSYWQYTGESLEGKSGDEAAELMMENFLQWLSKEEGTGHAPVLMKIKLKDMGDMSKSELRENKRLALSNMTTNIPIGVTHTVNGFFNIRRKAANIVPSTAALATTILAFLDILEFNLEHLKFEKGPHKYFLDGNPVDITVTSVANPTEEKLNIKVGDILGYPEIAVTLGNVLDDAYRDALVDRLKELYPNIGKSLRLQLIKAVNTITRELNKRHGHGKYRVITNEDALRVVGKLDDGRTVAGTMDMIVVDDKGDWYLYDFKTHRSNLNDDINEETLTQYNIQTTLYKNAVEAMNPKLKGKFKGRALIKTDLYYEEPSGKREHENGDLLYILKDDNQINVIYPDNTDDTTTLLDAIPAEADPEDVNSLLPMFAIGKVLFIELPTDADNCNVTAISNINSTNLEEKTKKEKIQDLVNSGTATNIVVGEDVYYRLPEDGKYYKISSDGKINMLGIRENTAIARKNKYEAAQRAIIPLTPPSGISELELAKNAKEALKSWLITLDENLKIENQTVGEWLDALVKSDGIELLKDVSDFTVLKNDYIKTIGGGLEFWNNNILTGKGTISYAAARLNLPTENPPTAETIFDEEEIDLPELVTTELQKARKYTSKEEFDREVRWLLNTYPSLSRELCVKLVEEIISLTKNGDPTPAYGRFKRGVIEVCKNAPLGTGYHEGFHAVVHMLLNEQEIETMLLEGSKKYKKIDPIDIEESLASDFRKYMLIGQLPVIGGIVRIFRTLKHRLLLCFNVRDSLDFIFYNIARGKILSYDVKDYSTYKEAVKLYYIKKLQYNNLPKEVKDILLQKGLSLKDYEDAPLSIKERLINCIHF